MREFVLHPLWTVIRAPVTRRTWAEVLYVLLGLPLAAVAVVTAAPLLLGAPLAVAFIGLPLVALTLFAARWLAGLQRELAGALIRERVPPPARTGRGLVALLRDRAAWRAAGYLALKLPLSLLGVYQLVLLLSVAFASLSYPGSWRTRHHEVFAARTEGGAWLVFSAGVGLLLLLPWTTRAVVVLDRVLLRNLLGPDTLAQRVRALEDSRAHAVDGSAAQLRRIERDLHDGAQVRLAALAMTLGRIQERLSDQHDPATRELVDAAHRNAKDALVELRQLARGIHPPALDGGLDPALATLAANSAVPVHLAVELPERPSPAIETIAYFCAAELLANLAKHSRASRAWVEVSAPRGRLALVVRDDGHGGARTGTAGGLAGLADRVRTVDGSLVVDSPPGGPTVVTVELPMRV